MTNDIHPRQPSADKTRSGDRLDLKQPSWPQVLTQAQAARRKTTEELADELGMSPQTLRKRFSQTGSYFSVKPIKLPNGRLLWPADSFEQLTNA